jgi:hypothetical protein
MAFSASAIAMPNVEASPSPTPEPYRRMSVFHQNLPKDFEGARDATQGLLLREYGAVFIARGNVTLPSVIVFKDETAVAEFQAKAEKMTVVIGGWPMTLQAPAMRSLLAAIDEAKAEGRTISPRDIDAAGRTYSESVGLWASRVEPALDHWTREGRITSSDAARIRATAPYDQVREVLDLERRRIYFAKDLNKSIIYSVAPPGASQHLALLAFDVAEHSDPRVRRILARNGWFQTVTSDLPHFTYLGVSEAHLQNLGLKKQTSGGRTFWVPDI